MGSNECCNEVQTPLQKTWTQEKLFRCVEQSRTPQIMPTRQRLPVEPFIHRYIRSVGYSLMRRCLGRYREQTGESDKKTN